MLWRIPSARSRRTPPAGFIRPARPLLAMTPRSAYGYENSAQDAEFMSFRELVDSIAVPEGVEVSFAAFRAWLERPARRPERRNAPGGRACPVRRIPRRPRRSSVRPLATTIRRWACGNPCSRPRLPAYGPGDDRGVTGGSPGSRAWAVTGSSPAGCSSPGSQTRASRRCRFACASACERPSPVPPPDSHPAGHAIASNAAIAMEMRIIALI